MTLAADCCPHRVRKKAGKCRRLPSTVKRVPAGHTAFSVNHPQLPSTRDYKETKKG